MRKIKDRACMVGMVGSEAQNLETAQSGYSGAIWNLWLKDAKMIDEESFV